MDSFEFNKIAGGILATALGVMAISIVAEAIFSPSEAEKPGMVIETADAGGGGTGGGDAPTVEPIAVRLASADVNAGQNVAKKCLACHTLEKGQPKKTGPNLYGIVGNTAAHMEGFPYSEAMEKKKAEGFHWTFENLDAFLTAPKKDIPGTAMGFAGLPKPKERADLIAYLRTLSDNPVPLPTPEAAPAPAAPAAPAPDATTPAPDATPPAPAPDTTPAPAPDATPAPAPTEPAPAPAPAPTEPTPAPDGGGTTTPAQ